MDTAHTSVSSASRPALSPTDQRVIEALREQDREVRRHEQAHFAAAGALARGGPRYTYRLGPDGKRYVVSGEVSIDTSPVPGDPQAALAKASRIRRAALAPTHPSGTDLAIASHAMTMAAQARQDLIELRLSDHAPTQEARAAAPLAMDETQPSRPTTPPTRSYPEASPPPDHSPSLFTVTALQSYHRAATPPPQHTTLA